MLEHTVIRNLAGLIRENRRKRKWRKNNLHNETELMRGSDPEIIIVGEHSYGELNVVSFNKEHRLRIGHYVSIAQKVTFLLDAEHHFDNISTYPFKSKILNAGDEAFGKGDIIIDDDVWIGYGAIINSGVHIGRGAVIASGAVVTRDVEPYAVAAGVPAKVKKYRFDENMRAELLKLDYSKLSKELIESHQNELYTPLEDPKQLEWFPHVGSGEDK